MTKNPLQIETPKIMYSIHKKSTAFFDTNLDISYLLFKSSINLLILENSYLKLGIQDVNYTTLQKHFYI